MGCPATGPGTGSSTCLHATPGPSPLPAAPPTPRLPSRQGSGWLLSAAAQTLLAPGAPAHNQPFVAALASPLRGGAAREPLCRMDVCVATVGQGAEFLPIESQQHGMKRKQGPGARAGRGRHKGPSVPGPGAWVPASSSKGEELCT